MAKDALQGAEKYTKAHLRKKRWYQVVTCLAAVVVFCTTYALILPAITMEKQCDIPEHTHTEACYTQVTSVEKTAPVCSAETLEIHQHTADCYDSDGNLTCGYANFVVHRHDSTCYDENGNLWCPLPEIEAHQHTGSCYVQPEKTVEEVHAHTDACYTLEQGALTCQQHVHTDACYTETPVLVCGLEESAGHQHGEDCFETIQTLTCGIDSDHQHTEDCYEWQRVLICDLPTEPVESATEEDPEPVLVCAEPEIILHRHTSACFDASGNLVCERIQVLEHQHTDACFETVEESVDTEALTCTLPEDENHTHSALCYGTWVLTCELEEHTHTEDCYPQEASAVYGIMLLDGETDGELPVDKLSGNETKYNPDTDQFTTKVRIDFQFTAETGKPTAGTVYTYTYPKGITVPDDVVSKGAQNLYDGDKLAGTYQFIKNEDGTYSVQVIFNQDYVNESGDTVTGYVQFEGSFSKEDMNDNGDIVVGGDGATVLVPGKEITYPKDETESYDIAVSKSGSWVQDGDKLVYTVYVRTTKGTPDPISFTDTITCDGLTLGEPVVTIEKGTSDYYLSWNGTWTPKDQNDWSEVSGIEHTNGNGELTLMLSKLSAEEKTDSNYTYITGQVYKITYTYPITAQTEAIVSPENKVTVTATDGTKGQTVTDSDKTTVKVDKDFSYTLDKSGAVASDKPGYIKWTVTVNNNEQDIAGAKLTDEMLVEDTAKDIVIYPAEGATVTKDESGKITDITFTATENGVNKNKYTITYYTPVEESWDGTTVTNKATFDPKPDETGNEKEVTASVTVSGVQLNKWGQFNGATNKIDWTITVNAGNLDIAGATLTDEMFAALSETDFTIEPSTSYSITKDTDGKITGITFTEVEDGKNTQSYTIKYSTAVTENENGTTSPVTNSATLSPGEGKEGTPIGSESTVKPDEIQLTKSGSYTWDKKISWTITVNASKLNIAGAVLTDEMFSRLTVNDITIKKDDWDTNISGQYTINTNDDGKITSITFKATEENGVNTNQYTITYTTDEPQEWNDKIVHNEAKLTLDGKETPGTADVPVSGDGSIAKNAGTGEISEDGTTMTIPWTVTLTIPKGGLPAGTTIVDDVTKGQWGNTNTNQWMTRSQITAWATNLTWTDDSGNPVGGTNYYNPPPEQVTFLASDGNTYTFKQINEYKAPAGEEGVNYEALTYTLFTIHFPEGLIPPEGATRLTFTYSTTVDLTKATTGGNKFYNDIQVGGKETGAEYTYYKPGVVKTDGNGSTVTTTVSNEGELTWKVKATVGEGNKKLTLIDTLPEGVTLESLWLTGWGNLNMELTVGEDGTISGTDSTNQYTVSGTYQDRVITLNIEPKTVGNTIQTGAEFTLTVTCQVDNAENQSESKTLTNTAKMELDDGEIGSSSQTQEWTYQKKEVVTQVVDKSGGWDNTNRIMNYTIILNPESKDLVEGADTLTLIDTMTYINQVWLSYPFDGSIAYSINAALIQRSVKLYTAVWDETQEKWVAGDAVTDWSWTYESKTGEYDWNKNNATNTITATGIPDGTPLMLQYSYRVTCNVPDEINGQKTSFDLKFSNTAKLEGTDYSGNNSSSGSKWEHSSDSAGVTTDKSYTFYKVEAGNYNVSLAGATFSVYQYDTDTGAYGEEPFKTYSTDASGSFQITRQEKDASGNVTFTYETNTLYKVTETVPPKGYRLPDEVKTFYFYFSSTEDTAHTLPENLPRDAVDLTNEARTVYVENVKNTTEISVEKKWLDENGSDETASHSGDEIRLQLYRRVGAGTSSGTGENVTISVTKQRDGNGYACAQSTVKCRNGSTFTLTVNTWGTPSISVNGVALNYSSTSSGASGSTNYIYQFVVSGDTTITGYADNNNDNSVTYTYDESTGSSAPSDPSDDDAVTEGTCLQTITLNQGNNWTATISDLLLTDTAEDGTTEYYYYYFQEVTVPDGYSVSYSDGQSGVQSGTITVTNRKNKAVISVTVDKVWKDVNGEDVEGTSDTLPDSIQVYLTRTVGEITERVDSSGNTGDSAQSYTLTKESGWTLTVGNLPKTDSDGNAYSYSFEEVPVDGYETTVAKVGEGSFTITNKKQPAETDLTVNKVWQDKNGNTVDHNSGSVTIKLYQKTVTGSSGGGSGGDATPVNVTIGIKDENNSYVYVQDEQGTLGSTQTSISIPSGTTITIQLYCSWAGESWATKWQDSSATANGTALSRTEKDGGKTYIFTCQVTEDTTIDVWKNWGDGATATVTIDQPTTASHNSVDSDSDTSTVIEVTLRETVTLSKDNDWSYTFTNLPLTGTDESGNAVTYYYYIEEVPVPNYDTSYDNNGGIQSGTITVTNKAMDTPEYQLPETGGGGTIPYTLGGLLLMAIAGCFLLYNQSKRRKEESASS